VELLGVSRASLYPSLVPVFALVVGAVTVGELPSLWQLIGLAIVIAGFRLTQRN
jgi:drug/metabolite transporter (DMT)-like permease